MAARQWLVTAATEAINMPNWSNFMNSVRAGISAFSEGFMSSEPPAADTFGGYSARSTRYDVFWSFFENTAYRRIHKWAPAMLKAYGLYEYTRSIYNPTYRIGSFWQTHLQGGALDMQAGDGKQVPSALPIVTDNEGLRPALSRLWRDSNWQTNKDTFTLYGAVLGDVALRAVDDPVRRKVYMSVVHPGTLASVTLDEFGNVKGYTIQEPRMDPRSYSPRGSAYDVLSSSVVIYSEVVSRDGPYVVYQTYLDGEPYAWPEHKGPNGKPVYEWQEAYGFIPLVLCQHINVGFNWGWSEVHATLSKIREADDLASLLDDQIRKTVKAKWAIIGNVKQDKVISPAVQGRERDSDDPEPGRDEDAAIYLPLGSDIKAMVAPLDIAQTSAQIQTILASLEQDHPELNKSIYTSAGTGNLSGRSIRILRQPIEEKVQMYRPHYDDATVKVMQMALSIGGMRGYDGYQGINVGSYERGALELSIGQRPVFADEPMDKLELKQTFWQIASGSSDAKPALVVVLRDLGWTDEQLAENGLETPEEMAAAKQVAAQGGPLHPAISATLAEVRAALADPGGGPAPAALQLGSGQ